MGMQILTGLKKHADIIEQYNSILNQIDFIKQRLARLERDHMAGKHTPEQAAVARRYFELANRRFDYLVVNAKEYFHV